MPVPYPLSAALTTAWGNAWLAGSAGLDDVGNALAAGTGEGGACLRAVGTGEGAMYVRAADAAGAQPMLLHLGELRRAGVSWFRLALPVPGDVADLAGPQQAQRAALAAGAAVIGGRSATRPAQGGVIMVPPGSAAGGECWQSWPAEQVTWTLVTPGEAEQALLACLRDATDDLMRLDVARDAHGALARLAAGRHIDGGDVALSASRPPPGLPLRSIALLDRCDRIGAILAAAARDEGAAVARSDAQGRSSALARLVAAIRRARAQAWSAGALALVVGSASPRPPGSGLPVPDRSADGG